MHITEDEFPEKSRTVCFAGPKPEKLPDGGDKRSQIVKALKSLLYRDILDSIKEGYNCFVTGLSQGVELWAGEIILELKAQGENIKLIAAVPYREYAGKLRNEEKFLLGNILLKADEVIYVNEAYFSGCMRNKNKYVVDCSGKLIAIDPGCKGEPRNTINYAEQSGIITRIINADTFEKQIGGIRRY